MKKLSNAAEAEMKKIVAYKKARICKLSGLQRCNLHFLLSRTFETFLRKLSPFYKKSGNDAYGRGWVGHVICVIMTHCL